MTDNSKIPTELRRIILDFTVSCLLKKPDNFVEYGREYFVKLSDCRKVEPKVDHMSSESLEYNKNTGRRQSVVAESYNPEDDHESLHSILVPKTDIERKRLFEDIKNVLIIRDLENDDLSKVMDAMYAQDVEAGQIIIEQGDPIADNFYVIDSGKFEASVKNDLNITSVVKIYENHGSFGELALMYNVNRAATVRAVTSGKLWILDRTTFKRIVLKSAYLKRERYQKLIDSVEFLKELTPQSKLDLIDSLSPQFYTDGKIIFHQGDNADGMYFIESGSVQCIIDHNVHGSVVVRELKPGDYLGELALLTNNRRALNAIAIGDTKLAFLNRETFERLLGPCAQVLTKNFQNYESQMVFAVGSSTSVYYRTSLAL